MAPRRTAPAAAERVPQWQTIYCSLILLLVVFFVMLLAYSSIDRRRFGEIRGLSKGSASSSSRTAEPTRAMAGLKALALRVGLGGQLDLEEIPEGFKVVLPDPLLFRSGEAVPEASATPLLEGIATLARERGWTIRVEGHTDDRPIQSGRFPSNWELSTLRAVQVLRFFQERGIPAHRLSAVGFAQFRPRVGNDTPEGRQMNRRIEIRFGTGR